MGMTMIEKILARASGRAEVKAGDIVVCHVDSIVLLDMLFTSGTDPLPKRVCDPERISVVLDHGVRGNLAVVAEHHVFLDHRVGPDAHIGAELDVGRDDSGGVEIHASAWRIAPAMWRICSSFSIGEIGRDRQRCATFSVTGRVTPPWLAANISCWCSGTG